MSEQDEYEVLVDGIFTDFDESVWPEKFAARLRADGVEIEWLKKLNTEFSSEIVQLNAQLVAVDQVHEGDKKEIDRLQALDAVSAKAHNSNLVEMANMREELAQLNAQVEQLSETNSSWLVASAKWGLREAELVIQLAEEGK